MGGRLNETPGTTSTERKLIPMERSNPSSHENENATPRYNVVQFGATIRYRNNDVTAPHVDCVPKNDHVFIFLNNSVKNEPIVMNFGTLNSEET